MQVELDTAVCPHLGKSGVESLVDFCSVPFLLFNFSISPAHGMEPSTLRVGLLLSIIFGQALPMFPEVNLLGDILNAVKLTTKMSHLGSRYTQSVTFLILFSIQE